MEEVNGPILVPGIFGQPYKWGCVSGFQSTVRLSLMNLILMNLNFLEYSMLPLYFERDRERGRGEETGRQFSWRNACLAKIRTSTCLSVIPETHMCACKHTHALLTAYLRRVLRNWIGSPPNSKCGPILINVPIRQFLFAISRATLGLAISELTKQPLFQSSMTFKSVQALILSPRCLCRPT